jgi:signal transduction histidine kinase/CheY-like chemotaxis protein
VHFHSPHQPSALELNRLDLYLRQASDFMQRCKMEQAIRENEEALREADRRKDEFLALLAHELRNPLAPIRYALAANKKTECTPDQRRQAYEIIDRQVTHMSRLLDDLLDVSRITRGALELKKTVTELTLIVGTAIETARPLLEAKHHTLTLDLPRNAVQLEADSVRLAQVFSNLLINAAKYTDAHGHIHLGAVQEGNEVLVSVRDNGIGIPDDMKPRLFTMFAQASTARERADGGLGIGLSLVRGLVTLHGGTIEGHSDGPGHGSEFIVRLPIDPLRQESLPEFEYGSNLPITGAGLKILVVDDNRDAADTCSNLLEACGHHVQTAYTGRRALELAEVFQPHALFLDIGLPDMNGYQIASRVRSCTWGRRTQLVAVTGWGQEEDRRRAFDAGFDHYLTKPVAAEDLEWLLQSISETLRQGQRSQANSSRLGVAVRTP